MGHARRNGGCDWCTQRGREELPHVLGQGQLIATPCTVAHQAPLSMGFPRQEYWNGLPFPPPGDFSNPGIEPGSPALQEDSLLTEPPGKHTW